MLTRKKTLAWATAFALFSVGLLLVSGLLVFKEATGSHPQTSAPAPEVKPKICHPVDCATQARISDAVAQAAAGDPSAAEAFVRPAGNFFGLPTWEVVSIFILVGIACVGIVVGTAGAATPACLFLIGATTALLIVSALFLTGASGAAQSATSALVLAQQYLNAALGAGPFISNSYNQTRTTFSAFNATANYLAYQASAAALNQLGNSTFNRELDIVQSHVATQLAFQEAGVVTPIAQEIAALTSTFDLQEGTKDVLGFNCPLELNVDNATAPVGLQTVIPFPGYSSGDTCPGATPSPLSVPTGAFSVGPLYQAGALGTGGTPTSECPAVYIAENANSASASNSSTSVSAVVFANFATSGAPNVVLLPVANNYSRPGPYHGVQYLNGTLISRWFTDPLGVKSGGYFICTSNYGLLHGSNDVFFQAPVTFPLDDNAYNLSNSAKPQILFQTTSSFKAHDPHTSAQITLHSGGLWFIDFPGLCIAAGGPPQPCIDYLTGAASNHYQWNARDNTSVYNQSGTWLKNLGDFAVNTAQAYWTFLRSLGYTSAGQVAATNCNIPTPSQLIPSTIPINNLRYLNVTSLLTLYYAYLNEIGNVYNSTTTLNSTTFCGHHVSAKLGSGLVTFGIYGYGWVYVPGAGHTSDGTGSQAFSSPRTWNRSGVIYINPTVTDEKPTVGKTWLLGKNNPTTLFVQPFLKGGALNLTNRLKVNATGPSWCVAHGTGCAHNPSQFFVSGLVGGNSSKNTGSAFGDGNVTLEPGTGYAVYLTACYQANATTNTSDLSYHRVTGTCDFSTTTVNVSFTKTVCGLTVTPSCAGTSGSILGSPGVKCAGDTIPLLGSIVDGVANWWASGTSTIPVIGGGPFGCVLGWIAAIVVVAIVLAILVAVVRAVWPKRSSGR